MVWYHKAFCLVVYWEVDVSFLTLHMAIELRNEIRRKQPSKSNPTSSVVHIMAYEGNRIVWSSMAHEVKVVIEDNVYDLPLDALVVLRKQAAALGAGVEAQKALFRAFLKAVFEDQDRRRK